MENWNESQAQFIEKLGKANETFNGILEKDPSGLVIGGEERQNLKKLMAKNEAILHKLKDKEFTVAIVGLEKAGKSTLGNALLKLMVLPEYTERCTYTTTEIRSGVEDYGEIFFYSCEEFNQDFQKMLRQIKYDGAADFSSLDLGAFNRFWESVADADRATYELYNGTTVEDIRAMLKGRSVISGLLGKESEKFVGKEALEGNSDFQRYITGINAITADGVVDRSPHPYAVKKVNIRSAHLGDMKHIVLYDVPGFDSPTDLHKKQTEEMLKEADAIILVTNVGDRPNLTGTQLDMLRKGSDNDGVRLNEKSFVFGNKIDKADNKERAIGNMNALRNDAVNKYQISSNNHVFFGSAKAYLDSHGMRSKDDEKRGFVDVSKKLSEWDLPNGDGVEALIVSMQSYYDNDRFEVLKKRAESTLRQTEEALRDILEKTRVIATQNTSDVKYVLQVKNNLDRFVKEAKDIYNQYQQEIMSEQPFSKLITDNIDEIYEYVEADSQIVRDAEGSQRSAVDRGYSKRGVDNAIRQRLVTDFTKKIVERTAEATQEKEQEIYDKLNERLLEIMEVSSNYDELRESARKVFDDIKSSNNGEDCRFNTLVKRFAGKPLEALIMRSFASSERLNTIRDTALPEFFSLAAYYISDSSGFAKDIDLNSNSHQLKIFSDILAHGDDGTSDSSDVSETEKSIRNFFEENQAALTKGTSFDFNALPVKKWAKLMDVSEIKFADVQRKLKRAFLVDGWEQMNQDRRIAKLESILKEYVDEKTEDRHEEKGFDEPADTGLIAVLDRLAAEAREKEVNDEKKIEAEIEQMSDKSDVQMQNAKNEAIRQWIVDTLNADITILRDITCNAVVKAIGLEQAFCSVINDNIEFIREDAKKTKDGKFDQWIVENVHKIMATEFAAIENNRMDNATRKNIIKSVEEALATIDA